MPSSTTLEYKGGDAIWFRDETQGWLPGSVEKVAEGHVWVLYETNKDTPEDPIKIEIAHVLPRNAAFNEDLLSDLSELSYLNEASVLNTIKTRYLAGEIYTYSGIVLTSVNPFCTFDKYDSEVVRTYLTNHRTELSPHLYAIAEESRQSLLRDRCNQTIIVSGESGAGKTMSAKYIMRYLAEVCVVDGEDGPGGTAREKDIHALEQRVLATNPILEAFGNAKTARNDNSSRFGKYVQIYFDTRGAICGAQLRTYLLEKTRVVRQCSGERNFHILHQLVAASDPQLRQELGLDSQFTYVPPNESIEGCDDAEQFAATLAALKVAGFTKDEIDNLLRILAAILHLGNLDFVSDKEDFVQIRANESLHCASRLLQVSPSSLEALLTKKLLKVGHESVETGNTHSAARSIRDAVAKYLYHRVFDHVVSRMNGSLTPEDQNTHFIGVLDIYGFERFERNSFEQFCINYANEKLQHTFNRHVFDLEQKLYEEEGIDWSFIEFYDNQPCIDLIEAKCGILDLLDEECKFPRGSDASFVAKLFAQNAAGPRAAFLVQEKMGENEGFGVKHFAYDVFYDCGGFLEKNRDSIPPEAISLLKESNSSFVRTIIEPSTGAPPCTVNPASSAPPHLKTSIGQGFKLSLSALMQIIGTTNCSYIRCIKPNENKQAMKMDPVFVLQQLRACGILETIRISASGYPGRWLFSDFFSRFSLFLPSPPPSPPNIASKGAQRAARCDRDACCDIIAELGLSAQEFQVGRTRVFMRYGILAQLEERRILRLSTCASTIQKFAKRCRSRRSFCSIRTAAVHIGQAIKCARSRQLLRAGRVIGSVVLELHAVSVARTCLKRSRTLAMVLEQSWRRYRAHLSSRLHRQRVLAEALISAHCLRTQAIRIFRAKRAQASRSSQTPPLADTIAPEETLERQVAELRDLVERLALERDALQREKREIQRGAGPTLAAALTEQDRHSLAIEKEALLQQCQSLQDIVEALEASNSQLFAKNQELQAQIFSLTTTTTAAAEKSTRNSLQSLARDRTSLDTRHPRRWSLESQVDCFGRSSSPILAESLKQSDVLRDVESALQAASVTAALDQVIELGTSMEAIRAAGTRFPTRIMEKWILAWLVCSPSNAFVGHCFNATLEKIRCECTVGEPSKASPRDRSSADPLLRASRQQVRFSSNQKFSFWLANLFDLVSFFQWAVAKVNDSATRNKAPLSERGMAEKLTLLIQMRTDVARLIEYLYRAWLSSLFKSLVPLGVGAILDHQGLTGFSHPPDELQSVAAPLKRLMIPFGLFAAAGANVPASPRSIDDLVASLDELTESMMTMSLPSELAAQVLNALLANLGAASFNQFLLRKNYASWKRGIQIQYNISRLDEWAVSLQAQNPGHFFPSSKPASPRASHSSLAMETHASGGFGLSVRQLEPLVQAVKLLQLAKTSVAADVDALIEACPRLNLAQIRKILICYVPDAYEDGPVSHDVIRELSAKIVASERTSTPPLKETLPEVTAQNSPIQLPIRPLRPARRMDIPTSYIPSQLWKIFTLFDSLGDVVLL